MGAFGENFTTEGLLEEAVHIGDLLRIGSAEFVITQPRMPCFKLGIRFGCPEMVKRLLRSGRTGFYLAVLAQGQVTTGAPIELLARDEHGAWRYRGRYCESILGGCEEPRHSAQGERVTCASLILARPLS